MSHFSKEALTHLKRLARIQTSEKEEKQLLSNLSKVLEYVHLLQEVDTESVPRTVHVSGSRVENVYREDEKGAPLSREKFLQNAPDQIAAMIRVPAIFSSEEEV